MTKAREVIATHLRTKLYAYDEPADAGPHADSILSALDKAGKTIVDKEPSEEMCRAYADAWLKYWFEERPDSAAAYASWEGWPARAQQAQKACLSAMLAAHKESNE